MTAPLDAGARYGDAIRRAERSLELGRPNAALLAYAEAAAASPERSAPYVAMGALHLGAGRMAAAIEAFEGALRRSPGEPDALLGRAQALIRAGRPAEAAAALDAIATADEARGDLLDALVAARRALELAESRPRRRTLAALIERARGLSGDQAADEIAHAERLLGLGEDESLDALPPALVGAIAAFELADTATLRGEIGVASDAYLAAAEHLVEADRRDAAIDACFTALIAAPADIRLHLTLAEIYARAGWSAQLAEKRRVLTGFLALEPDEAASARLAAIGVDGDR